MVVGDAAHPDEHRRAGAGVAVMLAQVQFQAQAGNLRIEGEVVAEAVLPIDLEAEEIDVEFLGLLDREDPQDRNCDLELLHAGSLGGRLRRVDFGRQDVPVIESELLGDELQAFAVRE